MDLFNIFHRWIINMDGVEGTLYEGEHFQLLFKFNNKYPFDSPEVTFVGSNIPVHPHVYSNGHICLSILTEDWYVMELIYWHLLTQWIIYEYKILMIVFSRTPALSVQSVCLSISSMLSSCREKKRPPDNTLYVRTCNKNPKKTKWWYHGKYLGSDNNESSHPLQQFSVNFSFQTTPCRNNYYSRHSDSGSDRQFAISFTLRHIKLIKH